MGTQSAPEGSLITPEPSHSARVLAPMKTIGVAICLALALALPAGAVAKTHPDRGDRLAAKAECKTLRGRTDATHEAFRTLFRNFAACVRSTARDEAREEQNAHTNAAKDCKAERDEDAAAFAENHGTGPKKRNALGKCVSEKAKAKEAAADERDRREAGEFKNAAKECDAERDADPDAFATNWGTNDNKSNAFGKCVSEKASEDDSETS
jgi:hypothetical protein